MNKISLIITRQSDSFYIGEGCFFTYRENVDIIEYAQIHLKRLTIYVC